MRKWHSVLHMADRPPRILLVDDEQPIQTLLSFPLQKDGYEVVRAADGREALQRFGDVEFEILKTLATNPGRVFTRDMLLTRIWGDSAFRDPRTIDVHIRHLREKLEHEAKEPEYLFTVRGVGYRFRDKDRDRPPAEE